MHRYSGRFMEDLLAALECVTEEFSQLPDGSALIEKIHQKFNQFFECPQVGEISRILHSQFSVEEIRKLAFAPSSQQISYYPALLSLSTPSDIRLFFLSICFIVHRRKWNFFEEFILVGGLKVLTQLLLDPNLYSRGQAVEIFLSLTDCDTYDWFLPISSNLHHLSLYREMYCLLDTPFLQNLLSNRTGSFPGGSMRCLQLLAFWLSWLRVHFAEQNKLKLHASLLNVINLWAIESEVESDESKLAMTLFEDFSTAGVYDFHSDHITSRSLLQGVISPPAFHPEVSEIVSPNQLEHFVLGRNNLKEKGNKYFAEAKYMEALGCYKSAIDEIEGSESVVEDCKLLATLYYNSANTYWKLSQQTQAVWSPTPNSFENFVDACITCCKRCLDLDPLYFKARYRFASTMQQLGRYEEALPYLDTKFLQPDLIPDQKMLDLLQDLRRTCIAQIIILQKETQSGFIDDRTSRILSQIALRRNHQQESPTISASSSGACDTSKSTSSPEIKLSKNSSISKRALKYLTKIRSCVALLNTQHRSDSPEIIQLTITLGKILKQIWKEDLELSKVLGSALDESILLSFILLVNYFQREGQIDSSEKLTLQIKSCDRFATTIRLITGEPPSPLRDELQSLLASLV